MLGFCCLYLAVTHDHFSSHFFRLTWSVSLGLQGSL